MYKLVLIRHGESQWNLENRFTGWQQGIHEDNHHSSLFLLHSRTTAADGNGKDIARIVVLISKFWPG